MERFKSTIIILLLALGLLSPIALAESPSVLFQQGLYAEETEGDLDKAMEIYSQVLGEYKEIERIAARATYQLGMCHLKKGEKEKAAEYFNEVADYYPEQTSVVKKAQAQLEKIGGKEIDDDNLFSAMGDVLCPYIGSKYGEVCAEAGMKRLYANCHIYFIDRDFTLRTGGMGYVYNWSGQPITKRHRLSGTSQPDQKLYDIVGNEMDIEIVPDKLRKGFHNIYWNPKEPLDDGEFFNYGWSKDGGKKLVGIGNGPSYNLTMQNHFGDHGYETFFLIVPEGTALANKSEDYTKMKNYQGWDIYWWKKEVFENTNNVVNVGLKKVSAKPKSPIDSSTPEATIKSFVKAVYVGNLEAAKACVSKDGHDYDEFMEMLAIESNHPFQAMIKAMDASTPVEITSKDITEDRCKIKWYFTLGRVYYIGDTTIKKGTHQKFGSYLELVGDKWLIRDI